MSELYPAIKPFATYHLDVGQGHRIHVEQTGNPNGIPVLFLHGGPGIGLGDQYRRFFDPQRYHVIAFDQRGCGQSLPFAELRDNTSQHLVEDALAVQRHLGIKKWVVFGGSWGSTLAMLVAIAKPEAVLGLILRGIFLARAEDIDWFLNADSAAAQMFPEHYQEFMAPIKETVGKKSVLEAYHELFSQDDELSKMAAIKHWFLWESRIVCLHALIDEAELMPDIHQAISLALLECHYFRQHCFIDENFILKQLDKIQHLPATIIHGRYDMICKMEAALTLHKDWQNSRLHIIPSAGHSAFDPPISAALCCATKAMADFIEGQ